MSILDRIRALPGVRAYRKRKYRRRFERDRGFSGLFYGVYGSFSEAKQNAPKNRAWGYDNPGAAGLYSHHLERVRSSHYPVIFWLSRRWHSLRRVLDFGGHRGSLFYACTRLLGEGPEWYVYDVPAVVEQGRVSAAERSASTLFFEDDLTRIPDADAVVAAGSLQYVEDTAEEWMDRVGGSPSHLILSGTPFHPEREIVTLNNMGVSYCPYKIRRGREFLGQLEGMGFEIIDEWIQEFKTCRIPFHVGDWDIQYRGAYLRMNQDA